MTNTPNIQRWDDDRLDRFANSVEEFQAESRANMSQLATRMNQLTVSVDQVTIRVDNLTGSIDRLVEALYVELPRVSADVNAIHDELISANETAKIQAESVRELIRLLNQRQA